LGAVDAMSESIGYKLTPASTQFRDAYIKKLRTKLGAARLDRLKAEGRSMDLNQLVVLSRNDATIHRP
ncbi:MAG TPA: hypothetical protein VJS17_05755, partial [Pyrinomonadaceae bacterium]|nr:hypothetical protein [Pyrinomonadaceae bacterium]